MADDKDWGPRALLAAALVSGLFLGAVFVYLLSPMMVGSEDAGGEDKVFVIDVYHWGFTPGEIQVERGDRVVLVLRHAKTNPSLHDLYHESEQEVLDTLTAEELEDWEANEANLTTHGFSIMGYPVNVVLEGETIGELKVVQFVADKPGTFTILCTVYCGPGHESMKGTLVVT